MRHDRTGEVVDTHADPWRDHACRRGWIGPTDEPKPCPTCRPWLLERPARPPTTAELDAFRSRHPKPAPKR